MLIIRICFQRFVNFCHSTYLELLLQNPVSTFIILLLILLSSDVELNTRSMRHKLEYIENISNETDLACLTETHLDQNITNDSILIEGYCKDPFRKDRNNSRGDIIVYFSNHLIVKPRTDLNFDSEAIWLESIFPAYKMLLCVVYRQPNANYPF